MVRESKLLVRFNRHLDTIMETAAEIQDSNAESCFHAASPQKPVVSPNMQDREDGVKTQSRENVRRKKAALSSTQLYNRTVQNRPLKWNVRKFAQPFEPLRSERSRNAEKWELGRTETESNFEVKLMDSKNPSDMKQVELLFPEYFSSGTNTYSLQQNFCCDERQKEMELINLKVKADPLIQSWMNLFGARYPSCL